MSVRTHREGRALFVTLDNPPVNAIGQAMRQGLLDAVRAAEREMLDRVIVTGAGRAFAAGADAREFDAPPLEPHLPDVLAAIDGSWVPWVAAIGGVALGGGAEIALACRMRVMAPDARIGFPEVTLGVIPGAGGTQRLPRLVGLSKALEMVALGKPIGAQDALDAGLVHAIEAEPVEAAFMVNSEALGCIVPTWELPAPAQDAAAFEAIRERIASEARGQAAPPRAVAAVEAGLSLPFDAAMAAEREAFLDLRASAQSRALRHLFFAERAARARGGLTVEPAPFDAVTVAGGGAAGADIASALRDAGLRVTLAEADAEGAGGRVDAPSSPDGSAETRLVIVANDDGIDVLRGLDHALPSDAVLATTSGGGLDEVARSLSDPSRLVGLRFHAPAPAARLVEIVRGPATADRALATGFALARRLGTVAVLAETGDASIGDRIRARYHEAAGVVLLRGSTPWEVDEAMVAFGFDMGPFEAEDLSGLDVAQAGRRTRAGRPDPVADRMAELGKLGRAAGAGWYRYPGGGGKVDDPIVADLAIEEARLAGIERTDYREAEIQDRLVLAMVNEAAAVLDEGIARNAGDVDLVTVLGLGFPRWRGGALHHADTLGAAEIVRRLRALEGEDAAYAPAPLLMRCAEMGTPLADAAPRN